MSGRIVVQLTLGAAESLIVVDELTASPDVLNDLMNRAKDGLAEACRLYSDVGFPEPVYDDSAATLEELFGSVDGDD